MALIAVGVLLGCGLVVGSGFALLYAFDPMGDEWVCSDGEAPGGTHGHYNQCYPEDTPLPAGIVWDPFGNRPMPYNCDKDGWVPDRADRDPPRRHRRRAGLCPGGHRASGPMAPHGVSERVMSAAGPVRAWA